RAPEALRHVHADVREIVLPKKLQRLLAVLLRHPRLMPELDTDPPRLGALGALDEVVLVRPPDGEPGRELEQRGTELAAAFQRLEGVEEARPEILHRVRIEVLRVDALLVTRSHLLR